MTALSFYYSVTKMLPPLARQDLEILHNVSARYSLEYGCCCGGRCVCIDRSAEWEKMFAVNVHAPMRLTRLLSPLMSKNGGGIIITTGSIAGVERTRRAVCS